MANGTSLVVQCVGDTKVTCVTNAGDTGSIPWSVKILHAAELSPHAVIPKAHALRAHALQ